MRRRPSPAACRTRCGPSSTAGSPGRERRAPLLPRGPPSTSSARTTSGAPCGKAGPCESRPEPSSPRPPATWPRARPSSRSKSSNPETGVLRSQDLSGPGGCGLGLRRWGRSWWCVALAGSLSACAHGGKAAVPPVPAAEARRPPEDPVARLVTQADHHLNAGLSESKEGHLDAARLEFDRAIDTYLTAPGGAYVDARLAEAYRRTLETIHLREMESLAAGDGFTETRSEPASIDEVGALPVGETPSSEETRARVAESVQQETLDLPIAVNDAVLSCIDLYQGRLRDWFEAALSRGQRYLPRIREVFASEGIPQDLAYVALVESAFKANAYSRARAKGVWQFISATGKRYGLEQDWWVDERSDPEKATRAAAAYLKELYGMFGDWNLALAAYNAGEWNVQRGINRYRTQDFWQLRRTRALRRETRNYVPLIHAAVLIAKAPDKYGFAVAPEPAPAYERVPVEGAVDLRVIAECVATPVEDIQTLNPELRRLATPAGRTFDARGPGGRAHARGPRFAAGRPRGHARRAGARPRGTRTSKVRPAGVGI